MQSIQLPAHLIALGYALHADVSTQTVVHPNFGTINFETLTVERAAYLHESGYQGIVKNDTPQGSTDTSEADTEAIVKTKTVTAKTK